MYILHKAVFFLFVCLETRKWHGGRLLSYFYLELRVTVTPNANFYLMFNWDLRVGERIPAVLDQCQVLKSCTYIFLDA